MSEKIKSFPNYFEALNEEGKILFTEHVKFFNRQLRDREIEAKNAGPNIDIAGSLTKSVYSFTDNYIADYLKKDEETAKKISCKKGCSFCCYLHVDITSAEADILAEHVTEKHHVEQFMKQSNHNIENWKDLPYQDRKCAFLVDGECSVYEDRPMSCRKYLVINDPEKCNTEVEIQTTEGIGLMSVEAILISTVLKYQSGTMSKMIYHALVKRIKNGEQRSIKSSDTGEAKGAAQE